MTVSLSKSRKNDTFIIPDLLRVLVNIFLHTLFVAHIDELAVRNRKRHSLGIFLINCIDITVDDFICLHYLYLLSDEFNLSFHISFPFRDANLLSFLQNTHQ